MIIKIDKIEPHDDSKKHDFMWVTVSITEDTNARPRISGKVKIPLEKQDITISKLEDIVIEKAKKFLSEHS